MMAECNKAIGIVVPIYNVEKYLKRCIDSILDQSYTNYYTVLVNDGSTDSSLEIAKEYVVNNERFILIDKENGGESSARNAGIEFFTNAFNASLDSNTYIANASNNIDIENNNGGGGGRPKYLHPAR